MIREWNTLLVESDNSEFDGYSQNLYNVQVPKQISHFAAESFYVYISCTEYFGPILFLK